MQDILIKNTTLLTEPGTIVYQKDLWISQGKIKKIGSEIKVPNFTGEIINGQNLLCMPGLIDSHLHTGQQLLRGRVLDAKPIIWKRIMLPFESQLTPEIMRLSAEIAALEMIKSGTTGFVEAGSYYMDQAASIYDQSGLRGALTTSNMDDPTLPDRIKMDANHALRLNTDLYKKYQKHPRLKVYYSLRALNSCSDTLILKTAQASRDYHTFLTAHMNEYPAEINGIIQRTGYRPYEFLEHQQILNDHFLGSHSIFLSDNEKSIIQKHHIKLSHSPFSNAGKGLPDTPDLLKRQISIGIGTDGAAHGGLSLWNEIKIFRSMMALGHGSKQNNPSVVFAKQIFEMVLSGGANALNETNQLGKLKAGYKADLIGINLDQPHLSLSGNYQNTLLESVNANDVTEMIVDGKIIMHDRKILTLDEERIMDKARRWMRNNNPS